MSDKICEDAILEYLVANSELARSLEEVTLEELLAHQTDKERCLRLLAVVPNLEKDRFKASNCFLDSTVPYDSLIGLSGPDLLRLEELCDYFVLPSYVCGKLSGVIKNGIDINKYIYDFDIKNTSKWAEIGDLRGLQWACKQIYPWIDSDKNDLFMMLPPASFHWNENTCASAAKGGYLDCLRYAYQHGCLLNSDVCAYAAANGHLDCLQYARERGCPEN